MFKIPILLFLTTDRAFKEWACLHPDMMFALAPDLLLGPSGLAAASATQTLY